MLVLRVKLKVKPEMREEFLQKAGTVVEATNQEAGCLHYRAYELVDGSNDFFFYEEWESQAIWDLHNATDHVKTFVAFLDSALAEPWDGKVFTISDAQPL